MSSPGLSIRLHDLDTIRAEVRVIEEANHDTFAAFDNWRSSLGVPQFSGL